MDSFNVNTGMQAKSFGVESTSSSSVASSSLEGLHLDLVKNVGVVEGVKMSESTAKIAPINTSLLLSYMRMQEESYGVTMCFEDCGVDKSVFEIALAEQNRQEGTDGNPILKIEGDGDGEPKEYVLIEVDGKTYLSGCNHVLDAEYLNMIITDACASVMVDGRYTFTLVGGRGVQTEDESGFLYSLRLNTFELSTLLDCLSKRGFGDAERVELDGRACIVFKRG